ncbi:dynein regulatory complex protein 1-like isoform X2 [Panulirus ornatus]|uniref:dynein regulatory complex protein 1-like isoform X2 n=1 Tax=Panulirus ornatus TaxID=150431 RepID=UPI003A89283E
MAAGGQTRESHQDNGLILGPKATKIKERLRNNVDEGEDMAITKEDVAVIQANQAGQRFTGALHTHEHTLHALVKHGCTMVGNVEVAALSGEVTAVVESEARTQAWRHSQQQDLQQTQDALNKMQEAWEAAVHLTLPEDLHQTLCQLKEWSQELTDQKVKVIEGLREELRALDTAYTNELLQHTHERSELLRRITEHVTELHQAYRTSLRDVQNVADKEWAGLVKYYGEVWDKAVKELNQQLQDLLHQRLHNRTSRMDEIIELKLHGAAPHTAIKDKLDSDIEKVLVEVMRMKAAQQVEESQLRYSQQVLQQQFRETTALVSEARRTLNALTPTLNKYRRKAEAAEERRIKGEEATLRETARMQELSQQYRSRLAQTTAFYSQQTQALSQMQYQALHEQVMQVVEIDRAIQHGVLAREWVEPDLSALTDLKPTFNPRHTSALDTATKILKPCQDGSVERFDEDPRVDEQFLTSLAKDAVFLINADTSHLTSHGPLLMLEHIFWELGIHSEADVLQLLRIARRNVVHRPQRGDEEEDTEGSNGEDNKSLISENGGLFTAEDVLNVLIAFCKVRTSAGEAEGGAFTQGEC